jgi:hypothetical protein
VTGLAVRERERERERERGMSVKNGVAMERRWNVLYDEQFYG